jgi:hypothetical protein
MDGMGSRLGMRTLPDVIRRSAEVFGDKPVLVIGGA